MPLPLRAIPFEWIDPSKIPRREWLYRPHYIRQFASLTVSSGGVGKSSLLIAEALAMVSTKDLLGIQRRSLRCMWPRERFAAHGIDYITADKPKSDIYLALVPLLNSRRVELLDHPKLATQLCSLERRTARGGRDSIDHAPNLHDDVANAVAGAIVAAAQRTAQEVPVLIPWITGQPIVIPGQSSTAFHEYYAGGGGQYWGPG